MPEQIDASVIVPVRDGVGTVGAQLQALAQQVFEGTWEVVVVDNGSVDGTKEVVESWAARWSAVRLIDGAQVRGPSWARNLGASVAKGRLLLFCDADDVVGAGWVAAMVEALSSVAVATGPQELGSLNPIWVQEAYGRSVETGQQRFAEIFPFGPSANLAVHRDLFLAHGGFDTELRVGEDLEFCLRLWHDGAEMAFVPHAHVHYRYRSSLRELWRQSQSYGKAAPELVRRCEALGHPVHRRLRGMKNWLWLIRSIPKLRTPAGRARWVVVAGGALGRVVGSIRARTVYL